MFKLFLKKKCENRKIKILVVILQIKIKNMYKDNRTIEEIQKNILLLQEQTEDIKKKGEEELNALKKETEAIKKAHETSSKKLESTMNNLGFNIGMGVEEMFFNGLKDNPTLNGIHFENVYDNVKIINEKGNDATEIDILMLNGTSVGLIETKHRFIKEDLQKFIEKQFPMFKKYGGTALRENIYLYIAGLSFDKEVILDAKKAGVGVLHLKNDIIKVEGEVRAFKGAIKKKGGGRIKCS